MAEQGNSKTTTVPESEAKNRRKLLGFFLFPIALFPLLALVSYRWQAMAALNIPPEASSNLIGVVGDTFAYYGYLLIGLAVWAVPPLTLFLGLLLVLGKSFRPGRRFLAFLLFLFATTCLLQLLSASPSVAPILRDLNLGHNAGGSFAGSQETRFKKTPVREIRSDEWCLAPFLVEVDRSTYVALLDAYLDNFPGRCFAWRDGAITTRLVPSPREGEKGAKARFDCRFDTPWRVILVGDNPGRFIESEIVQALNPPCAIEDTSWIRPGMSAWDHWWSGEVKMEMPVVKEYIDFAAKQGWPYMLVDWQWYGPFNTPDADITRTAPQIDMPELLAYAKERGVRLWLWLYSSDVTRNDAFEEAFALYAKWGVAGVKIDFMDRHDREIVNWYRRIAAAAAKNRLMLDFHGAYAPDGIERTYPNLLTREGVLGEEFSKFSRSITPDHNVTLAFTRMLAGPMDYTPGGFLNVAASDFKMQSPTLVMNTRAAELAKFVVYESPWMCFCDHPRNVLGQPGSEFVAEVPTVWDDTRFLGGYPGEWIAVARRSGDKWYLGVLNGNEAREVELTAPFLSGEGRCRYWSDGEKPTDVVRGEERVPATRGKIRLAAGGGFAAVWEAEGR